MINFEVSNTGLFFCHGHIDSRHVSKHLEMAFRLNRIVHGRHDLVALE
jgi:hypothetical protein